MPYHITQAVQEAAKTAYDLGVLQRVEDWRIAPRADFVLTSFQTTQPTVPIVEVFRYEQNPTGYQMPVDVYFPILGQKQTSHKSALGLGSRRLLQGQEYVMTVTAPATQFMQANPKPTKVSRRFTTLHRRCQVRLQRIRVRIDGDPGGSGEMRWTFGVYDAENGQLISDSAYWQDFDAWDGKHISTDIILNIDNAPNTLKIYAFGVDEDQDTFGVKLIGLDVPVIIPSEAQVGENDLWQWAEGILEVEIPDYPVGIHGEDYVLASKWGLISYYIDLHVETEIWSVTNKTTKSFHSSTRSLSASTKSLGTVAGAKSSGGKFHFLAPGTDNRLLFAAIDPLNPRTSGLEWHPIGAGWSEKLSLVAGRDGEMFLFTVDADGIVQSKSWREDQRPESNDSWHDLGGRMTQVFAVATERADITLIGQGQDRMLYLLALREGARGNQWVSVAPLRGSILNVLKAQDESVHVFAQEHDGQVLHLYWDTSTQEPRECNWQELNDVPQGELIFGAGQDNSIAIVSIGEQGTIAYKEWLGGRWQGDSNGWDRLENAEQAFEVSEETAE
jgi:hypothetical protein